MRGVQHGSQLGARSVCKPSLGTHRSACVAHTYRTKRHKKTACVSRHHPHYREDDDSTEQDTTATQQQQEQQPPQIPHRSTVGDPITTPKATPRSTHPTPSPAPPALHTGNNVSHMESHIGQEHALQHTLPREGLGVLQGALCRKIAQVSKALDALSIGQTVGDHESCATLVSLAEQLVRVHTHVVEAQGTRS